MFERFTEAARRAVFFARYEASNYGSPYIETEHLLLGILREHGGKNWFPGHADVGPRIRAEVERRITRGKAFSTSVEIPLSAECKRIFGLAAQASDRLGHRTIEAEHILIAILQLEGCLAAQILKMHELQPQPFAAKPAGKAAHPADLPTADSFAVFALNNFLRGLKALNAGDLQQCLSHRARFIDASGKCWTFSEIFASNAEILAPYAKKNATYIIDQPIVETEWLLVANILWKDVFVSSQPSAWMHRMTVTIGFESPEWLILALQVTPILPVPTQSSR